MKRIDGAELHVAEVFSYDVVIIGSGPAGSAAAYSISKAGVSCCVIEEGRWWQAKDFYQDSFHAMSNYYRDMSASVMLGNLPMPFIQGKGVGGTSLVNGAISWRLPEDVFNGWIENDPALEELWSYNKIMSLTDKVERRLAIKPTPQSIAGQNNLLLAKGAEALGLEHRAISRNVSNCEGAGRCLQGCSHGHKNSLDKTYLLDAEKNGVHVYSSLKAERLIVDKNKIKSIICQSAGGAKIIIHCDKIILAASAVQTPMLLLNSKIKHPHTGKNFQCHPGISVKGHYKEDITMWKGATQGHEVIGLRKDGIKFEALGFDKTILATRLSGVGSKLRKQIDDMKHIAIWGAAIKANGKGKVKAGKHRASVSYRLAKNDMIKLRLGASVMAKMHLAAGAEYVELGIYSAPNKINTIKEIDNFEKHGTLKYKDYAAAVTHMFSTARMSSDSKKGVVRPDFRHHDVEGLYIADSSVFPSNTGVNPQTSIIAFALACGEFVIK